MPVTRSSRGSRAACDAPGRTAGSPPPDGGRGARPRHGRRGRSPRLGAGALLAGAPHAFLPLALAAGFVLVAALVGFVVVPWARRLDRVASRWRPRAACPNMRSLLVNALELAPARAGAGRAPGGGLEHAAAAPSPRRGARGRPRSRRAGCRARCRGLAAAHWPRWRRGLGRWAARRARAAGRLRSAAAPPGARRRGAGLDRRRARRRHAGARRDAVRGRPRAGRRRRADALLPLGGGDRRVRMAPAAAGAVPESAGAAARGGRAFEAAVAAVSAPASISSRWRAGGARSTASRCPAGQRGLVRHHLSLSRLHGAAGRDPARRRAATWRTRGTRSAVASTSTAAPRR